MTITLHHPQENLSGRSVKRSVFRNLFFAMIAFGILVGLIFPPFAKIVLNSDRALSIEFFAMCVAAGFLVGLVNFTLFRMVVSRDLARVVAGMKHVLEGVAAAENTGSGCTKGCKLEVTSNDAIGEIESSFNDMTEAIARRLALEESTRSLHTGLAASVELEDVSKIILSSMAQIRGAKAALLYGDTGEALELVAEFGIDRNDQLPKKIYRESGPLHQSLESGKVLSLSPLQDGLEWIEQSTPLGRFRPKCILAVPLMTKGRAVGLGLMACNTDELPFDQMQILDSLRTQGAPYLQSAILHKKIKDLAAIDDLTLILNRRFGLRRLQEEFSRSVRHGVPLSVLMMDVDHFKNFNDTFGHNAGDAVLKMVSAEIESTIRSGDVVCRYGGEEFMVVAPGTGLNDAVKLGERLRRMIETTPIRYDTQSLSVTISMGVATWPMARVSISEELVTAADNALYFAKQSGRNQVAANWGEQMLPVAALEKVESQPSNGH